MEDACADGRLTLIGFLFSPASAARPPRGSGGGGIAGAPPPRWRGGHTWLDHLPASVAFCDVETTGVSQHDRVVSFGGIGMIGRNLAPSGQACWSAATWTLAREHIERVVVDRREVQIIRITGLTSRSGEACDSGDTPTVFHGITTHQSGHRTLVGVRVAFSTTSCSWGVSCFSPKRAKAASTIQGSSTIRAVSRY